ncbi:MAG: Transcriptional regulator, AcrR family, partial [uncultured Rubrobacteraceae bacterium]
DQPTSGPQRRHGPDAAPRPRRHRGRAAPLRSGEGERRRRRPGPRGQPRQRLPALPVQGRPPGGRHAALAGAHPRRPGRHSRRRGARRREARAVADDALRGQTEERRRGARPVRDLRDARLRARLRRGRAPRGPEGAARAHRRLGRRARGIPRGRLGRGRGDRPVLHGAIQPPAPGAGMAGSDHRRRAGGRRRPDRRGPREPRAAEGRV